VRVRIVKQPSGSVDGVDLSKFSQGNVYDMSTSLATLMLVSEWAESVTDEQPALVVPLDHPEIKRLVGEPPEPHTVQDRRRWPRSR
jgi:hypothetical protein